MAFIEKNMQNHTVEFRVFDQPYKFDIWVNTDEDTLFSAVGNWVHRTEDYSAQSLCDYINSKGAHRATPAKSLTEDERG